jgi:16S rRNA (guanine966-N2)-methyltransferase
VCGDAHDYLRRTNDAFDVVFLDPPFGQNALPAVLQALAPKLAAGARVYVEAAMAVPATASWEALRAARAGQVSYQLLQWKRDDER